MRLNKRERAPGRYLVLRLGETPEQCRWIRLDDGLPVEAGVGLPDDSTRPLRVLAPGTEVSQFRVSVPTRSVRALAQAVPFALEEQVAVDIERLHCVPMLPAQAEGLPVLVVSHARIQEWLGWLSAAGLQAECLVPETLLLPREPSCWHLWVSGQMAWLSPDQGSARMLDRANLALMLEALLASIAPEQRPERLVVSCFDEEVSAPRDTRDGDRVAQGMQQTGACQESLVQALEPVLGEIPIDWRGPGGDWLTRLVTEATSWPKTANLLTGPYDHRARLGDFLRPWRAVASLAGVLVLLQFVGLGLEGARLKEEQRALEAQIIAVYQEAFPNGQPLDPKRQMASALASLGQVGAGNVAQFGRILAAAGPPLVAEADVRIDALRFRTGQLDLDLQLASLQSLERLRERLAEQTGWTVEIRSANRGEAGVDARLSLREGTS